jgi:hypothetical protein
MGTKSHSREQVTARRPAIRPLILATSAAVLLALAACASDHSAPAGSGPNDAGTNEQPRKTQAKPQNANDAMPDSSESSTIDAYVPVADAAGPQTDATADGSLDVANLCIYDGSVLPPRCNCREIDASTGARCAPDGVDCLSCNLQPWCFCVDAQWSCGDPSLNDCVR